MPAEPALDGRFGCAVWLVILKGLDGNSFFLQICNLYTIRFHILSYLLIMVAIRKGIDTVLGTCAPFTNKQTTAKKEAWLHSGSKAFDSK